MTDTTKTEALRLLDALKDSIVLYKFSISHGSQREEQHAGDCMGLAFKAVDGELRRLSAVEAERDRLAAECEALRADAAMLGWLASHCASHDEPYRGGWAIHAAGPVPTRHDCEDAFRAAITAAMGGK